MVLTSVSSIEEDAKAIKPSFSGQRYRRLIVILLIFVVLGSAFFVIPISTPVGSHSQDLNRIGSTGPSSVQDAQVSAAKSVPAATLPTAWQAGQSTPFMIPKLDTSVLQSNMQIPSSNQKYTYQLQAVNLSPGIKWAAYIVEYNPLIGSNAVVVYANSTISSSMTAHLAAGYYLVVYGLGQPDLYVLISVPSSPSTVNLFFPALYDNTFTEVGLPSGANFTLEISKNNVSYLNYTTGTSMSAYLPNGTYRLYGGIGNPDIFMGSLTISGASVSATLSFPSLYKVTFQKGTPSYTSSWGVFVARETHLTVYTVDYSNVTTASSFNLFLPTGSYFLSYVYNNSEFRGNPFAVNSSSVSITVNFPTTYAVTFVETGLGAEAGWVIQAFNSSFETSAFNFAFNSTSITLYLPDGIYQWSVTAFHSQIKLSGEFGVTGQAIKEKVQFPELFKITFSETGLTPGVSWGVYVSDHNGSVSLLNSSTGSTVSFCLSDGNFNYTFNEGSLSVTTTGVPFKVSGASASYSVSLPKLYRVQFTETGLYTGASWALTVSNATHSFNYGNSSAGATMIAFLPLGNFNYSAVETTPGTFYDTISTPVTPLTESGSTLSKSIAFPKLTLVTFDALNLSAGYCWEVSVTNSTSTVSIVDFGLSGSLNVFLPEGIYNYTGIEGTASGMNYLSTYPLEYVYSGTHEFIVGASSTSVNVKFPQLYKVPVSETGLTTGTCWSVFATGSGGSFQLRNVSYGSTINMYLPNGTYYYTIYEGNYPKSSGSSTVAGYPTTPLSVVLSSVYEIKFVATQVPNGGLWLLKLSTSTLSNFVCQSETSNTVTLLLPSGKYNLSADYQTVSVIAPFTVSGATTVDITFKGMYAVTFTESGLPSGSQWYVNFTGYYSGPLASTSYCVQLLNGTYDYAGQTAALGFKTVQGTATVSGGPKAYTISFSSIVAMFGVTLSQIGLPSGTTWYAGITSSGGTTTVEHGTGNLVFSEANGSYTYNVSTSNKNYAPSVYKGSLTVGGYAVSESITFSAVKYGVSFSETGLPAGSSWYVNITGNPSLSSSGSSVSASLMNGTYTFRVSNNSLYYATAYSGTFTVNGNSVSESVQYIHYSYIQGTVTPANATVTVNGKQVTTSSGSFNISVPEGTYHLVVSETGYSTYYDNFTISQGDQVKQFTVGLTSTSPPSPAPSPPVANSLLIYAVIAAVIIVLAIVGALIYRRRK